MSFYGRCNQDDKWFSGIGVLNQLLLATNISLVSASSQKILLKATHTVRIPPPWCLHLSKVCGVPACHSWGCHPRKTAQTCGAALIFPYKSIPSPLNHLTCSSLNLLQFVYILPGPGCLKVNTPFRCHEFSSQTLSTAQRILRRALAASRAKKWPVSSFQRGHFFLFQSSPFVIFSV